MRRRVVAKWFLRCSIYALSIACALSAFEFAYRRQLLDTYAPELVSYNPGEELSRPYSGKTILVMGDSFSAGTQSYPALVRRHLPSGYRIINAAVSGTCALEGAIMAPRRFARFRPSLFIYQLYVGNDLFETRHPTNWRRVSLLRNAYWRLSNRMRSLVFINYRLMQQFMSLHAFLSGSHGDLGIDQSTTFSVSRYTRRSVISLQAEPGLLYDQITVAGSREKDFERHLKMLKKVVSHCTVDDCVAYVLVIPHCCQVHRRYLQNAKALGATFNGPEATLLADEYPFLARTRRAFLAEANVNVLSPLPLLSAREADGQLMYFQNDEHLTPPGQELIAAFVLRSLNLRPEP